MGFYEVRVPVPLKLSTTFRAPNHCRIAQKITNSGAINAQNMIFNRRKNIAARVSAGAGMFGWTATQVHRKTVAKQLLMMVHVVRRVVGSGHVEEMVKSQAVVSR